MKEEFELEARQKVMDQQKADALKEAENSAEAERETYMEDAFQAYLIDQKVKLGLITEEELEAVKAAMKKK